MSGGLRSAAFFASLAFLLFLFLRGFCLPAWPLGGGLLSCRLLARRLLCRRPCLWCRRLRHGRALRKHVLALRGEPVELRLLGGDAVCGARLVGRTGQRCGLF